MKALNFTIETLEPLLVANPVSGDENSATGLDYIPGSVIRGALATIFTKGRKTSLADDGVFKALFFGEAYFLNAYPLLQDQRSLPTPLSWYRSKDAIERDPLLNLAIIAPKDIPNTSLKRVAQPFAAIQPPQVPWDQDEQDEQDADSQQTPAKVWLTKPDRHVSVHIQQNDRLNVVQSGSGTVYRYDALPAGEQFRGVILSNSAQNLEKLKGLLTNTALKLGKSRSAGYGAVLIEVEPQTQDDWQELTPMSAVAADPTEVSVTLLSDAIVRNPETGAFTASLAPLFDGNLLRKFARTHIVGGFNQAWGLPLPQARAIQAGSVFVFERTPSLMEQLQKAQADGVGERCVDGFGRISVDWHVVRQIEIATPTRQEKPKEHRLTAGTPDHALAQLMANRIRRAQLDAALRNAIGRSRIDPPMNNAQLSRIRVLAREAWRQNNAHTLGEMLKEPDGKKDGAPGRAKTTGMKRAARDQFERSRISTIGSTKTLLTWLQTLAADPMQVWNELEMSYLIRPNIGGAIAEDPPALEYMARLIDGVLRRAAKEDDR
jgi:CRISPR-associated protein Csx10